MAYKVLVVDDSKLARMSVAKTLGALRPDWTRVEASSADEALELVKQSQVDLALLDFNMPGRDGLELAAELRARNPGMPVAVVSANHQAEVIARAQSIGAMFLLKPLTEPALADFIASALVQIEAAAR
jgi:CheY-like chemotaxis protein